MTAPQTEISIANAQQHIAQLVRDWMRPNGQTIALPDAYGRVLAADVVSPVSVPPHDNSAMDGYAFNGQALDAFASGACVEGSPLQLRIVGKALAGKPWQGARGPQDCVQITTGAVMPEGCDTVVPLEMVQTTPGSDGSLYATFARQGLRAGDNRRQLGEDLLQGSIALAKGTRLTPAAMGLLASLGLPQVTVYPKLRVAYFSTGDEILSLGDIPRAGAVYDSNRYTVIGMLKRLGDASVVEVVDMGVVPDQPEQLSQAFARAAQTADVIITSGGVSVGEADHTKSMMRQLGDVAFWRIAMRPGRPMAVGKISNGSGHALLFGLPGNPVAVMVTFLALVRPALLQMMGCPHTPTPLLKAKSLEPLRKKPGRTEYQRGIVRTNSAGELVVQTTGNQGSGVLSSMVQANGLIVLGHTQASVAVGDWVDVMMFEGVL